ncbi:MAG: hypothetical protein HZC29_05685, partial [Thaumarchaeota archaeon]|nr:hypothetical protein [Nitrososphaerota archaeon]
MITNQQDLDPTQPGGTVVNSCDRDMKCKMDGYLTGSNGNNCYLIDAYASGGSSYKDIKSGKWDYSQSQCINCDGNKQDKMIATTTQKCYDYVSSNTWNALSCASTGSNTCESACGAIPACDDKAVGGNCGGNKQCKSCSLCCDYSSYSTCGFAF